MYFIESILYFRAEFWVPPQQRDGRVSEGLSVVSEISVEDNKEVQKTGECKLTMTHMVKILCSCQGITRWGGGGGD